MTNSINCTHLQTEVCNAVATIRIDRPERRNAFTNDMYRAMASLLKGFDADPAVRCIVVRGNHAMFTSGSDIAHFLDLGAAEREAHFQLVAGMLTAPARMGKPVVAAVQGFALGGGTGLTAACDFAMAEEGSTFGLPEVRVGLWPCTLLPALVRAIGARKAYELALLGDRIEAKDALALGLLNRVVPAADFEQSLAFVTEQICAASPVVVQMGKRAFQQSLDTEFQSATRFMGQVMALNSGTEDARIGIEAFLQRKTPQWLGR
jgi:enoyl-CoA hydratase